MPVSDYKITLVFEGPGCGWTESLYKGGADLPTDALNLAVIGASSLLNTRRTLLSERFRIKAIKCANVNRERDGLVVPIPGAQGQGTQRIGGAALANQSEQVDDAANLRLYNGTSLWRTYPVRGLPNHAFTAEGTLSVAGPFHGLLISFITAIKDGQWCLRQAVKGDPVVLVDALLQNQQVYQLVTSAAIPGITVASTIDVKDTYGMSNVNGRYRVVQIINPTNYRVVKRQRLSYGEVTAATGIVRAINYTYPIITRGTVVGEMTRKTGRPLDESRGRALVRRS